MNGRNFNAKTLIEKYKAGTCTDEEKKWVEKWYENLPEYRLDVNEKLIESDTKDIWVKLHSETKTHPLKPQWSPFIRKIAAVFIATLGILGAYYTYSTSNHGKLTSTNLALNEFTPGSNKATLTLADGKNLILDNLKDGQIVNQNGIVISKTEEGNLVYEVKESESGSDEVAYNTISTPRGGQYKIILPDGTSVWLNSASSLKYPTRFTNNERYVELKGEAYFEVVQQAIKKTPFIVKTSGQEVEVLGTHFNINAYEDELKTRTTLLEGSVKVTALSEDGTRKSTVLKPGQQSIKNGNYLNSLTINTLEAISWKNGYFQFEKADLQTVMRQFARWYDIEILYETNRTGDEFMGQIPRSANLSTALQILNLGGVEFRKEGRSLIITK